MVGKIKWTVVDNAGTYQYDVSEREYNDPCGSVRDAIVDLLLHDWDTFGESGDCLTIFIPEDEEE